MTSRFLILGMFATVIAFNGNALLKELGEKEYQIIKGKSNLPAHGACWHDALRNLKNSCDNLNDHQHSLLALRLTNCFLEDSGHVTYECYLAASERDRRDCINSMSDRAFGVYNEFYTHTTNICFYLNHELWQAETEDTIKRLYEASSKMRDQLVEASEIQGIVLESQREGLRIQNELLDNGRELGNVIKTSADTVSDMVVDFKETAKNQKELLYEIFSYMRTFENWVLAEVSWFQTIVYYVVACILSALFSSSKRTSEARVGLFTVLSLNVVVERMMVQYHNNIAESSPDDKLELVHLSWHCRKIALIICCLILLYTYYAYSDGNFENYKVLCRIEHQLNTLKDETQPLRYSKRLLLKRIKDQPQERHPDSKLVIEKKIS